MAERHEYGNIRTRDGLGLCFCRDMPPKARGVVVLLHSVAEHSMCYDRAAEVLKDAGYGVYRYDCRGHGRSDGARGDLYAFGDYLRDADLMVALAREGAPSLPLFLAGDGMGGFVAAAYAALWPERLDGGVASGAAVRIPPALGFLRGGPADRERGDVRFSLCTGDAGDDPLRLDSITVRLAGNVWLDGADWFAGKVGDVVAPMLILHGADDAVVPPEQAQWLYDSVSSPDKSLRVYPSYGGLLLRGRDDVLADVVGWLDHRSGGWA